MTEAGSRVVVVATGNVGKVAEIRSALAFPGWRFVTAAELDAVAPDVEETGATFLENARIKAHAFSGALGLPALADDSGLEVDALGGAPGVRSARYAGEGGTDADNNAKLLAALQGVAAERRTARFRCSMVFVDEHGHEISAEGRCEGRIGLASQGSGGFGYDPLFLPDAAEADGRTMAELDVATKNAISHRGAAIRALREELERVDRS